MTSEQTKLKWLYLFWHHTFPIPGVTPLGEVVYGGKLNESREDKGVADGDEPVHGCGIGHLGQRVSRADTQGGHGKDSGHSCSRQSIRIKQLYVRFESICQKTK